MKKVVLNAVVVMGVMTLLISCKDKEKPATKSVETEQITTEESETPDMHNAANSLDFEGVYEGIIPCADCEGIKLTVAINEDGTFKEENEYLGVAKENTFSNEGTWNIEESTITFTPETGEPHMYFVGEGFIKMLDQEGNEIESDFAEMYILKKK
ncbi:copper resistance protein NlpE [Sinomicrobium sp. M5D2P17]